MYTFEDVVYAVAKRVTQGAEYYKKMAPKVDKYGEMKITDGCREWRLSFARWWGCAHVEYDRRNRDGFYEWNSLMDVDSEGNIFVYESGLDTNGGGPADQVIIYQGRNLSEAVRKMLAYRPVEYGWYNGHETFAARKKGTRRISLKRVS